MTRKMTVIGGGPGGYVCALRAAALGADVVLVEKERLGGTCLHWGCIPSKVLKDSADRYLTFLKSAAYGIQISGEIHLDLHAVTERKKKVIAVQESGIQNLLSAAGVTVIKGHGKILSARQVAVSTDDGQLLQQDHDCLVLATGTVPAQVTGLVVDHNDILSSNDLLSLQTLPESIVIVGGGIIGCEFACILSAFGVKVVVVEAMERLLPLPSVDQDCSRLLLREMKKKKITVLCNTVVSGVQADGDRLNVHLEPTPSAKEAESVKTEKSVIVTRKVAVCTGRSARPLLAELGLDTLNIELTPDKAWIQVNERMETSVSGVFAIGDMLGPQKPMLAHVASHEGMVAAEAAMGLDSEMAYHAIPGAIFTMPEIGVAGMTQAQLEKKNIPAQAVSVNFRNLGKAHAIGEIEGFAKLLISPNTGKILGCHIIGPHATDLISEAVLAIKNGLTVNDIAHTVHAHPTLAEIMGEAALKAIGSAVHG